MATPHAAPSGDPLVPVPPPNTAPPPAVVPDPNAPPPPAPPPAQDTARDKGRRELASEYDAKAKALGFPDAASMFAALERKDPTVTPNTQPAGAPAGVPAAGAAPAAGQQPAGQPAAGAQPGQQAQPGARPGQQPGADDEIENNRAVPEPLRKKLRDARQEMRNKTAEADRARQAAEERAKGVEMQMEVLKAEQHMREDLIRAGVKDLDYTWFELKKHLEAIKGDEAKLKEFDLKKWADEQRKVRPFLFGEMSVPANSAPATPPPAAPPGPGQVQAGAGDATKVDARTLAPTDMNKRLAAMGLNIKVNHPAR